MIGGIIYEIFEEGKFAWEAVPKKRKFSVLFSAIDIQATKHFSR